MVQWRSVADISVAKKILTLSRPVILTGDKMDKSKGFAKHASSKTHLSAMAYWKVCELRTGAKQEISTHLNEKHFERNRHYESSVSQIIQFICINELPLHDDGRADSFKNHSDNDEGPSGLFLRLFENALSKNK